LSFWFGSFGRLFPFRPGWQFIENRQQWLLSLQFAMAALVIGLLGLATFSGAKPRMATAVLFRFDHMPPAGDAGCVDLIIHEICPLAGCAGRQSEPRKN